jgi:hypothetical protein
MGGYTYQSTPLSQALRNLPGCIDYFQQRNTTAHEKQVLMKKILPEYGRG